MCPSPLTSPSGLVRQLAGSDPSFLSLGYRCVCRAAVLSGPGGRMAQTGSPLEAPEFMPWGFCLPPTWAWAASPGERLRPLLWGLPLGAGSGGPVGPGGLESLRADLPCWRYCFHPPKVIPHPRQVELKLSWSSSRGGLAKPWSVPCSGAHSSLGARSLSSSSSIRCCLYSTSSGPCFTSGPVGSVGSQWPSNPGGVLGFRWSS